MKMNGTPQRNNMPKEIGEYQKKHRQKKKWLSAMTCLAAVVVFCVTYALILPAVTLTEGSDPAADVETAQDWEKTFEDVELTGNYAADLLQIAQTQLGYKESTDNFVWRAGEDDQGNPGDDETSGENPDDGIMLIDETQSTEQATEVETEQSVETEVESEDPVAMVPTGGEEPEDIVEVTPRGTEEVDVEKPAEQSTEVESETGTEQSTEAGTEQATEQTTEAGTDLNDEPEVSEAYSALLDSLNELYAAVKGYGSTSVDTNDLVSLYEDAYNTAADLADQAASLYENGELAEDEYTTLVSLADEIENYIEETVGNLNLVKKGYTRYGAWYGDAYGDWCAMFVSFCLNYAEVPTDVFPQDASCGNWISSLSAMGLYHSAASSYTAEPGDLVFFDLDGNGTSDHVGIVVGYSASSVSGNAAEKVLKASIKELADGEDENASKNIGSYIVTIEGNSDDKVQMNSYSLSDGRILGYGELPENENLKEKDNTPEKVTSNTLVAGGSGILWLEYKYVADGIMTTADSSTSAPSDTEGYYVYTDSSGNIYYVRDLTYANKFDITISQYDEETKSWVEVTDSIDMDKKVQLEMEFTMSMDAMQYCLHDGYYELEYVLPEDFTITDTSGTLYLDGLDAGTYEIKTGEDGKTHIYLHVSQATVGSDWSSLSGKLTLQMEVNKDKASSGEKETIDFGGTGNSYEIEWNTSTKDSVLDVNKTASTYDATNNTITYTVTVTAKGDAYSIVLKDVMNKYLDPDTLTFTGSGASQDGKSCTITINGTTYTITAQAGSADSQGNTEVTFKISSSGSDGFSMSEGDTFTFSYSVEVDGDSLESWNYNTATNSVEADAASTPNGDVEEQDRSSTSTPVTHWWVTKTGNAEKNESGGYTITWSVTLNSGDYKENIAGNTYTDVLDLSGLGLDESTLNSLASSMKSQIGSAFSGLTGVTVETSVDATSGKITVTIKFDENGTYTDTYTFTYTTTVTEEQLGDNASVSVNNKISDKNNHEGQVIVPLDNSKIKKTVDGSSFGEIGSEDGNKLSYKVTLSGTITSSDKYEDALSFSNTSTGDDGGTSTDTNNYGSIDTNSLKITIGGTECSIASSANQDGSYNVTYNGSVVATLAYTTATDSDGNTIYTGYTLDFSNLGNTTIDQDVVITYDVTCDSTNLSGQRVYKNKGTWKNQEADTTYPIEPEKTLDEYTIEKKGVQNTDGTVTWTIVAGPLGAIFAEDGSTVTIEDLLTEGLNLEKIEIGYMNSSEVSGRGNNDDRITVLTVNEDGTISAGNCYEWNGSDNILYKSTGGTVEDTEDGQKITLYFTEGNLTDFQGSSGNYSESYIYIDITTSVDWGAFEDAAVENGTVRETVDNTVTMTVPDDKGPVSGDASVDITDDILKKSGWTAGEVTDASARLLVTYTVEVNPTGADLLENADFLELYDEYAYNSTLLVQSLKVYDAEGNELTYVRDKDELAGNTWTYEITFDAEANNGAGEKKLTLYVPDGMALTIVYDLQYEAINSSESDGSYTFGAKNTVTLKLDTEIKAEEEGNFSAKDSEGLVSTNLYYLYIYKYDGEAGYDSFLDGAVLAFYKLCESYDDWNMNVQNKYRDYDTEGWYHSIDRSVGEYVSGLVRFGTVADLQVNRLYCWYEKSAPSGYIVDGTYHYFVFFEENETYSKVDDLKAHLAQVLKESGAADGTTFQSEEEAKSWIEANVTFYVTDPKEENIFYYDMSEDHPQGGFANYPGTTWTPEVEKALTGRSLDYEEFGFTITATDESWNALTGNSEYSQTVRNNDSGGVVFDQFVYTEAGTYYYTITEEIPEGANKNSDGTYSYGGIIYTPLTWRVTVTVTSVTGEDGSTTLEVSSSYQQVDGNGDPVEGSSSKRATFENEYKPAEWNPDAEKIQEGGTLQEGAYSFTITEVDESGNPIYKKDHDGNATTELEYTETVTNSADGTIPFSKLEYTAAGTHYYKIVEEIPEEAEQNSDGTYTLNGVTYDATVWYVEVTVEEDASSYNGFKVSYTYSTTLGGSGDETGGGEESVEKATFTNTVENVKWSPDVTKSYKLVTNGSSTDQSLSGNEFSFTITEVDEDGDTVDGGYTGTAKNDANGKVSFDDIEFTEPGTYYFKVTEDIPEGATQNTDGSWTYGAITYDGTAWYYVVTVTQDESTGELTVESSYYEGSLPGAGTGSSSVTLYFAHGDSVSNTSNSNAYTTVTIPSNVSATVTISNSNSSYDFGWCKIYWGTDSGQEGSDTTTYGWGTYYSITRTINSTDTYTWYGFAHGMDNNSVDTGVKITVAYTDSSGNSITKTCACQSGSWVWTTSGGSSGGEDTGIVFNNTTDGSEVSWTPGASKSLNGGTLENEQFSFTITEMEMDGSTLTEKQGGYTETAKNDSDGKIAWSAITLPAAGTYYYKITEVVPDGATANSDGTYTKDGITYGGATYYVKVVVGTGSDGKLTATVAYYSDESLTQQVSADSGVTFTNKVENGVELPETGGPGAGLLYALAILLIFGCFGGLRAKNKIGTRIRGGR